MEHFWHVSEKDTVKTKSNRLVDPPQTTNQFQQSKYSQYYHLLFGGTGFDDCFEVNSSGSGLMGFDLLALWSVKFFGRFYVEDKFRWRRLVFSNKIEKP
jgi:hypothetical protein